MLALEKDRSDERRTSPRSTCHKHCLVRFNRRHLDGHPGNVAAQGYISDLSVGGMGLLLRPAIPAGSKLSIAPFESPAPPLPAHVVRCVPAGKHWKYGCILDRTLTEKELHDWLR